MPEHTHQWIVQQLPGRSLSPDEQVGVALSVVREGAERLDFFGLSDLEDVLTTTREGFLALAAAGVLRCLAFFLAHEGSTSGVAVNFDPDSVADYEHVDLSRLALGANPEARAFLTIASVESPLASSLMDKESCDSLSTASLTVTLLTHSVETDAILRAVRRRSRERG